jgi:hypothetical protein
MANALVVEGAISANGLNGRYGEAGAGGGIHLDVGELSGAGVIRANGGSANSGYYHGGGGRISMVVDKRSGFAGSYSAATGSGSGNAGGAGTIYIKDGVQAYGHLIVNNGGMTSPSYGTPIHGVGRHAIVNAYETVVGSGEWKVEVAGTPWQASDTQYDWGVAGIDVDLDASEELSTLYTIASNDTNVLTVFTTDDLSGYIGKELVGVHTFETLNVTKGAFLSVNSDKFVVSDPVNSQIDALSRVVISGVDYVLQ